MFYEIIKLNKGQETLEYGEGFPTIIKIVKVLLISANFNLQQLEIIW